MQEQLLSKEDVFNKIFANKHINDTEIDLEELNGCMDEWAKIEAIAFAEWKDKNYISPHRDGNFIHKDIFFTKEHFRNETFYTIEQLYTLFKEQSK